MTLRDIVEKFKKKIEENNLEDDIRLFLFNPSTTDIDRVTYITKYLQNFKLFPSINKVCKNNDLSTLYRNRGNTAFEAHNWQEAYALYTKSIAFATHVKMNTSTECLAMAYANRAAVLLNMGYCEECIQDIDRALKLDYPSAKRDKLILRKQKALQLPTKEHKFYDDISTDIISNTDATNCISNKVHLNSSAKQERELVAARDIEPGELISIEEPYVAIVTMASYYINCCHCMNYILNPIPCDQCPYALFCNEDCKQLAQHYHKFECSLMETLWNLNTDELVLILRILFSIKNDLRNVMKLIESEPDIYNFGICNENEKRILELCSNYAGVHYYNSNPAKYPHSQFIKQCIMASILLNLLERVNFFNVVEQSASLLKNPIIYKFIGKLLLHHAATNSLYTHKIVSLLRVTNAMHVNGIGVYPFYGLLKHSCDPNVLPVFYGKKLVLRASRPIKKGDKLYRTYDFVTRYEEMSKSGRHGRIYPDLLLVCQCQPCVKNWRTIEEMKPERNVSYEIKQLIELVKNVLKKIEDPIEYRKKFRMYLPKFQKYLIQLESRKPCFEYGMLQRGFDILCKLEGNMMPNHEFMFNMENFLKMRNTTVLCYNIL